MEEVHQYFPSTLLLKVYTILDLHNFVLSVRCWLVAATSTTDVKTSNPVIGSCFGGRPCGGRKAVTVATQQTSLV
jgi:hypothetical protein